MSDNIAIDISSFLNFANMENLRRKCNPMMDLPKFTSNKKNIELSCSLNLQPSLLLNFVRSLIMLSLKKFRVVPNIFLRIKNHKFLKITYNN